MIRFMQQNQRAFGIVGGMVEEVIVERDHLEGKVDGCISLLMPGPAIPPVVRRAIRDQIPEHESFLSETLLVKNRYASRDHLLLLEAQGLGRFQKRSVKEKQNPERDRDDNQPPADNRMQTFAASRRFRLI